MDEHGWKANKWKLITAVVAAVVAGIFAVAGALISKGGNPSSTSSDSARTSSAPQPTPGPSTAEPLPSPSPTPSALTDEPLSAGRGLPYQWQDVSPRGDVKEDARVYMLPPAGPQSNYIEIGGVGFPGNSKLRIEERTNGRRFEGVLPDGRFISTYTSPPDCEDYVVSILTEDGMHLADLTYDTQC